jgi:hypothetical protein
MIIENLKISVKYPKKSSYLPPAFGQICCRKIAQYEYCFAAEIINENDSVSLYKNPIEIKAFDEKDYYMGRNGAFPNGSYSIQYVHPKTIYIFVTHLACSHRSNIYPPPISTRLFGTTVLNKLKIRFNKLRWKNLSGYYFPQALINNDLLIKEKGKQILQFDFTNQSSGLHSYQINIGFYNNGTLIGGAMKLIHYKIKKNKPKLMKIDIPFELPPDFKYIIQCYADTPFLRLFLKKKPKSVLTSG